MSRKVLNVLNVVLFVKHIHIYECTSHYKNACCIIDIRVYLLHLTDVN